MPAGRYRQGPAAKAAHQALGTAQGDGADVFDVLLLQRSRHGKVSFCQDPMEARRTEVQLHWPRRNPQVAGVIFADDGIGDLEAE